MNETEREPPFGKFLFRNKATKGLKYSNFSIKFALSNHFYNYKSVPHILITSPKDFKIKHQAGNQLMQ